MPDPAAGAVVLRPRLLQFLDRAVDLTVVHALPGFGKTTLVWEWAQRLRRDGMPVEWVNMADTPDPKVDRLSTELGGTDGGVLVLEDLPDQTDPVLLDTLCALLGSTPSLRLVVLANDWVELRSTARRHRLSLQEIRGESLLADAPELSAMGTAWGHEMSNSRTAKLLQMTGGWPKLAKLLLDFGCGQDFGQDEARRFLSHQVATGAIEPNLLRVASCLSLAPQITALHMEQTLQLLPGEGPRTKHVPPGSATIMALEEAGLLRSSRDAAGTTSWRIPELLRQVLEEYFCTFHSALARSWHGRMAEVMFADGRDADQAMILHHARRGKAWGVLAGMWNRHTLMLTVSQPRNARAAYMRLPGVALESEPILALAGAAVTAAAKFDGSPNSFAAGHRALMQAFRTVGRPAGNTARQGTSLGEQACMAAAGMIAHRSRGRFAEAMELADAFAKRAADVSASGGPSGRSRGTAWFRQQRAMTAFLSGNVAAAREIFPAAYDCAGPNEDFIAGDAAANMALVCTLSGLPNTALEWLETAGEKSINNDWVRYLVGMPEFIARVLLAVDSLEVDAAAVELAKTGDGTNHMELWPFVVLAATELALLRGDAAMMELHLEKAVSLNSPTYSRGSAAEQVIARCRAELLLAQGELNQAARVLDDASDCPGWLEVSRARLQLLAGNHNRAFRLASAGVWSREISQRDKIDLLLIKAAAAEYRGDIDTAGKAFAQAIDMAGASGQLRPFRGLSPAILLVLADRAGVALPAAAQEKVQAGPPIYPVAAVLVDLTQRELTVLYEMVRHGTAADIAKTLVVSPNTVKKQLGSIYNKLGVHDRLSALEQAHRLAFLPEPGYRLGVGAGAPLTESK